MATPTAKAITERLCTEYSLRIEAPGLREALGWRGAGEPVEQVEADLATAIATLGPGTHLIIEHPGLDTEEMRALGHRGNETVAMARTGVTRALTSEKVRRAIRDRGVRLISHLDLPAAR